MDVITDYGDLPIENLKADQVFSPKRVAHTHAAFMEDVPVRANHTYGVLINKNRTRGFFYFRVVDYVPNQKVTLQYVVKDYQISNVERQSAGFDWKANNLYHSSQ